MDQYKIIDMKQRLPHWQAFHILVPGMISETELESLTRRIAEQEQTPSEFISCHWWRSDQNVETDDCWATSKKKGDQVSVSFNGQSQEEHLDAVETRPLHDPSEIGLWFLEQHGTSHYVQPIRLDGKEVLVRTFFADGSKGEERKRILHHDPLRILWSEDWDEDEVVLEIDSGNAVLRDKSGVFAVLRTFR